MNHRIEAARIRSASMAFHMKPTEIARVLPQMRPAKAARMLEQASPPKAARTMNLIDDKAGVKAAKKMESGALARMVQEAHPQDKGPMRTLVFDKMSSQRRQRRVLTEIIKINPREGARSLWAMKERARVKAAKKMKPGALAEVLVKANPQDKARVRELMSDKRLRGQVAKLVKEVVRSNAGEAARLFVNRPDAEKLTKKVGSRALADVVTGARSRERAQMRALVSDMRLGRRQGTKLFREVTRSNPKEAAHLLANRSDAGRLVRKVAPEARVEIAIQARQQDKKRVSEVVFGNGRLGQRVEAYRKVAEKNQRVADKAWDKVQTEATGRLAERLERARAEVIQDVKDVKATACALESRSAKALEEMSERLESVSLARALERIQSPAKAIEVLQNTNDKKATSVFGMMEPTAAARLVRGGDEKVMVSLLERMPSQRVAPVFEKLQKIDPMLADRRLGAMNPGARADAIQAMNARKPEAAAAMWERMDAAATVEILQRLPIKTFVSMAQSMAPEAVASKLSQIDASIAVNLLARIDKDPTRWRSYGRNVGEGMLVGTLTAAAFQIPSIVQQGGDINASIISSFVGSAGSTALLRFFYSSTVSKLTLHRGVPFVGGNTLARSSNSTEVAHATLWSSVVTVMQSAAMHYLGRNWHG